MKKRLSLKENEILIKYSAKERFHPTGDLYNYSIGWRKFAFRISRKREAFRNIKIQLQNNICPICELELYDEHLHHITYRHECNFDTTDKYPNCSECFLIRPDLFKQCDEKTVVVHKDCHRKLHRKQFLCD